MVSGGGGGDRKERRKAFHSILHCRQNYDSILINRNHFDLIVNQVI